MEQAATRLHFATVDLATGPTLHYADQGELGGEAIVFLHGWPDSWFSFSRVLPLFGERYHAYVLDQRGFGDSGRPDCCYAIDDFAADVPAFLDAVGLERATIVGHSFGTFVARRTAEVHPERVERLVLIGSAVTTTNEVMLEVQASLQHLRDPVPVEFAREFQSSTAHVPLPERFFERIVAESLKLPARLWREVFEGLLAFNDEDQLSRITAPTLIMWGDRDGLFSREEQDRLAAAIPDTELSVYRDTGHCPNWERPDNVAADLDRFMREK
jgi:non-heme chloroperoxidase